MWQFVSGNWIWELQEQLHEKDIASQQEIQQLNEDTRRLRHELDQMAWDKQQLREEVLEKQDQIEGRDRQLRDNEHIIAEFQQTLVQKDKRIRDLEETISAREREGQEQPKVKPQQKRSEPPPPPQRMILPPPRKLPQQKRSEASHTAVDTIKLNWRQCPKAPDVMYRGSAAVNGSMAYFNALGSSSSVHAYDTDKEAWSQMPGWPKSISL